MFSGLKLVFTGGISSRRAKVFATQVQRHGGAVYTPPVVPAMFRKRGAAAASGSLPEDVTHIVVDNANSRAGIQELLGVSELPDSVKIVNSNWVERSLETETLADEQEFLAELPATTAQTEAISTTEVVEQSTKRQRTSRARTATTTTTTATTSTVTITTAAIAPSLGRAATPGRWQDTESKSCSYMLATPTEASSKEEEEKEAGPVRVAAFDFDGTLVVPKSGKTHPTAASDWALWNPAVANRLRQLQTEGYRLVIFTNQKLGAKGLTQEARKQRVEQAVAAVGVPMDVFMAFEDDIYRKPCPGMWELFVSLLGREVDMSASSFVGDAAGRPATGPRKRDFSASDRRFAENVGLTFHTPEQFFLSSREKLPDGEAHPLDAHETITLEEAVEQLARPVGLPEIVLFFGPPGCGKSTLATTVFASYARANQDLLKTKKKCFDVAESALREGKSVVVDNTNRNRDTRREWIEFARAHGVPIRCVIVEASKDVCFHLNKFRGVSEPGGGRMVPSMVIHSFFKSAEQPLPDEGFDRIDRWPFRVLGHDCVQAPHLLRMHLA